MTAELDPKDIELVMEQTSCSKEDAIKALQNYNGDIVNTIMSLQNSSENNSSKNTSLELDPVYCIK